MFVHSFGVHLGGDISNMGWLTCGFGVGCRFGTLYAPPVAEKQSILINVIIFIIGVNIQCCSATSITNGASFILGGRFITGMGMESLSMTVPMHNAEVASPEVATGSVLWPVSGSTIAQTIFSETLLSHQKNIILEAKSLASLFKFRR